MLLVSMMGAFVSAPGLTGGALVSGAGAGVGVRSSGVIVVSGGISTVSISCMMPFWHLISPWTILAFNTNCVPMWLTLSASGVAGFPSHESTDFKGARSFTVSFFRLTTWKSTMS